MSTARAYEAWAAPGGAPIPGDRILLSGLRVRGHHGVLPHQAQLGQVFVVDLELALDLAAAGRADDLDLTVDYGSLAGRVAEVVGGRPRKLLEAAAEDGAHLRPGGGGARGGPPPPQEAAGGGGRGRGPAGPGRRAGPPGPGPGDQAAGAVARRRERRRADPPGSGPPWAPAWRPSTRPSGCSTPTSAPTSWPCPECTRRRRSAGPSRAP